MTDEQLPMFEVISQDEFTKAQSTSGSTTKAKKYNTEDRTLTGWWKLPSFQAFCTVPSHEDVIRALKPEAKEYRQRYPVRHVFTIGEYDVCRDCYIVEADRG